MASPSFLCLISASSLFSHWVFSAGYVRKSVSGSCGNRIPVSVLSQAPLPKITSASASSSSLISLGGLVTTFTSVLTPRRLVACSNCQANSVRSRSYSCRPGAPCSFGPAQNTIFFGCAGSCARTPPKPAIAPAPNRNISANAPRTTFFQKLFMVCLPPAGLNDAKQRLAHGAIIDPSAPRASFFENDPANAHAGEDELRPPQRRTRLPAGSRWLLATW